MYTPTVGSITLDDQDLGFLNEDFTRDHVLAVSQDCIVFDMSIHNVNAMGLAGPGSTRKTKVCRTALMHEFGSDLPNGYDTQLRTSRVNLSGGEKRRLAIDRVSLRKPTIPILSKHCSG